MPLSQTIGGRKLRMPTGRSMDGASGGGGTKTMNELLEELNRVAANMAKGTQVIASPQTGRTGPAGLGSAVGGMARTAAGGGPSSGVRDLDARGMPTSPGQTLGNAAGSAASRLTGGTGGYLDEAAADLFAQNPEAMLADMIGRKYSGRSGDGLYQMLKPYADAANVLFLAEGGQSAEGGTKEQFLKWLGDYYTKQQTPGTFLDWEKQLGNITNAAAGSPLESYLSNGDPSEQVSNAMRLLAGVYQTSFHPLFANAVMDDLALQGDRFIGSAARGARDPFIKTLNAPRLIPR